MPTILQDNTLNEVSENLKLFYSKNNQLPNLIDSDCIISHHIDDLYIIPDMGAIDEDGNLNELGEKFFFNQNKYELGRLLIEGAAGIGKTSFLQNIAYKWSKGEIFTNIKYLFRLDFRNLPSNWIDKFHGGERRSHALAYLIYSQLSDQVAEQIELKDVIEALATKEILLLIDGTEIPAPKSQEEKILKKALEYENVIMITRPDILDSYSAAIFGNVITITGFSSKKIEAYIKSFFKSQKEAVISYLQEIANKEPTKKNKALITINKFKDKLLTLLNEEKDYNKKAFVFELKRLIEQCNERSLEKLLYYIEAYYNNAGKQALAHKDNSYLENILANPLSVNMYCLVFSQKDPKDITTATDLYKEFIVLLAQRILGSRYSFENIKKHSTFKAMKDLAYKSALNEEIIEEEAIIEIAEKYSIDHSQILKLGLLKTIAIVSGDYGEKKQWSFLNSKVHSFILALHLKELLSHNNESLFREAAEFIAEHRNEKKYLLMLKFLAEMITSDSQGEEPKELVRFWEAVSCNRDSVLEIGASKKVGLLMHLLMSARTEGQIDDRIPNLNEIINFIDTEILKNVKFWVRGIKETGYFSPKIVSEIERQFYLIFGLEGEGQINYNINQVNDIDNIKVIASIITNNLDKFDNRKILDSLKEELLNFEDNQLKEISLQIIVKIIAAKKIELTHTEMEELLTRIISASGGRRINEIIIENLRVLREGFENLEDLIVKIILNNFSQSQSDQITSERKEVISNKIKEFIISLSNIDELVEIIVKFFFVQQNDDPILFDMMVEVIDNSKNKKVFLKYILEQEIRIADIFYLLDTKNLEKGILDQVIAYLIDKEDYQTIGLLDKFIEAGYEIKGEVRNKIRGYVNQYPNESEIGYQHDHRLYNIIAAVIDIENKEEFLGQLKIIINKIFESPESKDLHKALLRMISYSIDEVLTKQIFEELLAFFYNKELAGLIIIVVSNLIEKDLALDVESYFPNILDIIKLRIFIADEEELNAIGKILSYNEKIRDEIYNLSLSFHNESEKFISNYFSLLKHYDLIYKEILSLKENIKLSEIHSKIISLLVEKIDFSTLETSMKEEIFDYLYSSIFSDYKKLTIASFSCFYKLLASGFIPQKSKIAEIFYQHINSELDKTTLKTLLHIYLNTQIDVKEEYRQKIFFYFLNHLNEEEIEPFIDQLIDLFPLSLALEFLDHSEEIFRKNSISFLLNQLDKGIENKIKDKVSKIKFFLKVLNKNLFDAEQDYKQQLQKLIKNELSKLVDSIQDSDLDKITKNFDELMNINPNEFRQLMKQVYHWALSDKVITRSESKFILKCIEKLEFSNIISIPHLKNGNRITFTIQFGDKTYSFTGESNLKHMEAFANIAIQHSSSPLAEQYRSNKPIFLNTGTGIRVAASDVISCKSVIDDEELLNTKWKVSFVFKSNHLKEDPSEFFILVERRALGSYTLDKITINNEKLVKYHEIKHPNDLAPEIRAKIIGEMEYTKTKKPRCYTLTLDLEAIDAARLINRFDKKISNFSDNQTSSFTSASFDENLENDSMFSSRKKSLSTAPYLFGRATSQNRPISPSKNHPQKVNFSSNEEKMYELIEITKQLLGVLLPHQQELQSSFDEWREVFTERKKEELCGKVNQIDRMSSFAINQGEDRKIIDDIQKTLKLNFDALNNILQEQKQRQSKIDEINLINDEKNEYKKAFYNALRLQLNSIYIAASALNSQMIKGKNDELSSRVGDILEAISLHTPLVGVGVSLLGEVFKGIGQYQQNIKIENYLHLVADSVEMSKLAEKVARKIALMNFRIKKIDQDIIENTVGVVHGALNINVANIVTNVCTEVGNRMGSVQNQKFDNRTPSNVIEYAQRFFSEQEQTDEARGEEDAKIIAKEIIKNIFLGFYRNVSFIAKSKLESIKDRIIVDLEKSILINESSNNTPTRNSHRSTLKLASAKKDVDVQEEQKADDPVDASQVVVQIDHQTVQQHNPQNQVVKQSRCWWRFPWICNMHEVDYNNPKLVEDAIIQAKEAVILKSAQSFLNDENFAKFVELIKDKEILNEMFNANQQGDLSNILKIIFGLEDKDEIMDSYEKIKIFLGDKEFYSYKFEKSLSNNNLSMQKLMILISDWIGNLQEWINDKADKAKILAGFAQLDALLDFQNSINKNTIPFYRPPYHDPDDFGGGNGGGGYFIDNPPSSHQDANQTTFMPFVGGVNITNIEWPDK